MPEGLRQSLGFKITIMPKPGDNVNKISMQDIHGRIQVRSANQTNYETQQGEHEKWTFEIEITFSELLRHSDRLHYIVESKDRSMVGEIFVVLLPPWYKDLLFALQWELAQLSRGLLPSVAENLHQMFL